VELSTDRSAIGRAEENDISLDQDGTASHMHAVLERFPAGWAITDLGSSNGTWVNGERIWSPRRLRHGDEIRVGQTRVIFRDPLAAAGAASSPRPPSSSTSQTCTTSSASRG
jgi:pSer/pThr/pTyr-binding forkhead associated (FHA) protein